MGRCSPVAPDVSCDLCVLPVPSSCLEESAQCLCLVHALSSRTAALRQTQLSVHYTEHSLRKLVSKSSCLSGCDGVTQAYMSAGREQRTLYWRCHLGGGYLCNTIVGCPVRTVLDIWFIFDPLGIEFVTVELLWSPGEAHFLFDCCYLHITS